jgi:hypothetical protein
MSHPSELTSEEALRYLIECALMSGTNAAKAGAIERLRTDIKELADVRALDGWAVREPLRGWGNLAEPTRCVLYRGAEPWPGETSFTAKPFIGETPEAARAKATEWAKEQAQRAEDKANARAVDDWTERNARR